jgi:predicted transcriptional regulator
MIRELANIDESLKTGRAVEPVTVRTFLSWFGAQRRGFQIVHQIREQLNEACLVTVPDFESRWVDADIEFRRCDASQEHEPSENDALITSVGDGVREPIISETSETIISWVSRDPSYRISKLAAANGGVTSLNPAASLSEAVTLMLVRDFSQLPVMIGERDVKGVISWMSIGLRLALGHNGDAVKDLMQEAHEVHADISIFEAISVIVQHGYVLVRDDHNKITGIVTASDLSLQFRTLTEPFLLLSEIENLVRNMIGDRFTAGQLATVRDPGAPSREIRNVADLTFGEYIRLLENPERWVQLDLAIDRVLFCRSLDQVRVIRNDVTHFDPDGITPSDLETLRDFTGFLKQLEQLQKPRVTWPASGGAT